MDNYIKTVASQYANSPTILQLIDSMNQYIDPASDFESFLQFVWNVDSAVGFGLDIWGRIVGIDRNITISDSSREIFGFDEGDGEPFNQAPFYDGRPPTTTYTLDDVSYRKLILVKALSNISICSAPSINQQLKNLFPGRGRCYVNDYYDMTMRLVFEFQLEPFEFAIISQSGAITKPAGVEIVIQAMNSGYFGYKEGDGEPFNVGIFF